jgi:hypothetical protein
MCTTTLGLLFCSLFVLLLKDMNSEPHYASALELEQTPGVLPCLFLE